MSEEEVKDLIGLSNWHDFLLFVKQDVHVVLNDNSIHYDFWDVQYFNYLLSKGRT